MQIQNNLSPTIAQGTSSNRSARSGADLAAEAGFMAAGIAGGTELEPVAELFELWADAIAAAQNNSTRAMLVK